MSGESSDELLQTGPRRGARRPPRAVDPRRGARRRRPDARVAARGDAVVRSGGGERVDSHRHPPVLPASATSSPTSATGSPTCSTSGRQLRTTCRGDVAAGRHVREDPRRVLRGRRAPRFVVCGSRCSKPARTAARASSTSPADTAVRCASSAATFPEAKLVACDISRDAVDFCAQEFGAIPVYSQEDPAAIELPGPFDVIWVGSLFTHVPEPQWIAFLDLLASVLSEDGLLVFTVQGRHVRGQLLSGMLAWDLSEEGVEQIVRGYDEHGFGYADWAGASGYGTTLNRPSWVARQIEERPGLRLVGYRENGLGTPGRGHVPGEGEVSGDRGAVAGVSELVLEVSDLAARRGVLHPRPRPAVGGALAAPGRDLGTRRHDPDRPLATAGGAGRKPRRSACALRDADPRCRVRREGCSRCARRATRSRCTSSGRSRTVRTPAGRHTSTTQTGTSWSSGPPTWATTGRNGRRTVFRAFNDRKEQQCPSETDISPGSRPGSTPASRTRRRPSTSTAVSLAGSARTSCHPGRRASTSSRGCAAATWPPSARYPRGRPRWQCGTPTSGSRARTRPLPGSAMRAARY